MAKTKPVSASKATATKKQVKTTPGPMTAAEEKLFQYLFMAAAAVIFILRMATFSSYGPSSDEVYHKAIGDFSYDYLVSGGKNDTIFKYNANNRDDAALLLNYGPLLEVASAAIYKNFGTDPLTTRHGVFTFFTFFLLLFAGLTAQKIAGWRAGFFALLMITVSPRILGESFNNAKDPTFAAGYMIAVYGLIVFVKDLPRPSWRNALILLAGCGLAFGVRVGGILLFAYLGLFVGIALITKDEWRKELLALNLKYYQRLLLQMIAIVVGAWIIGIITWPAALRSPISHPFTALDVQSQYPTVIRVLFDGRYIPSNEVPWNYTINYILYTSPLLVVISFFGGLFLLLRMKKLFGWLPIFIVLFVSVFPIFYVIYKKAALYNGWRHSYFMYCGIVVFAALSIETLLRYFTNKNFKYAVYVVVATGVLLPSIFIAKNYQVMYAYFNELAGGVDGTYGDYQLDYYAHSAKPAADWFAKNIPYDPNLKIVSNNPWELNEVWKTNKSKFTSTYIRFRERNEKDWDYAIFLPQFVDPYMMKKGFFPPKGTVHSVKVDNSVVACIVKRESKDDYNGIEALKKNDIQTALPLLEKAVQQNPANEIAQAYLGIAYAMTGKRQEALNALTNSMNISPEYQLAQMYYNQVAQGR